MENTPLRGRFSLSTTNLTSPIAESTCLNGTSSQVKFNWGEGTISPRSRNNTITSNKNASLLNSTKGTPTKVAMSPISRIDPRTYVDIHSNGLASRIVKYHDNSARLNRSASMGNLYNKPGQFPVVHLKKNELQYKAKKSKNLSMTRIAAPEKSVFHGNTLSSILRSGSIVGMQKSDEEISRENRPILHPPTTETELAPTRSVLDVLKEISRKRINSDELDGTELIKKHCKEPEFDTIPYNGQKTQSKRQREMSNSTASSLQISPEQQVVKKRMCNYNNDITSSLSSSMSSVSKKKILEIQNSQKLTAFESGAGTTSNTNSADTELSQTEKQRCLGSFELERVAQSMKYTAVTPLQSTPQQTTGTNDDCDKNRSGQVARRASEPVLSNSKPKLTLFNKDYDEVPTKVHTDIANSREDGDLCGIQFVKPKKSSSLSSSGTLLMEKAKKSKLALMLSGLKGELNEEDEVDAAPIVQKPKEVEVTTVSVSVSTTSAPSLPPMQAVMSFVTKSTSSTTVTQTANATSASVAGGSTATPTVVKGGLQYNSPATASSVSSGVSNGFQISTTAVVASTTSSLTVSAPSVTTSAPISTVTSIATPIPVLGGFSFGLNKPLPLPTTTTVNTIAPQPSVPQVKIAISTSTATLPATGPATTAGTKPFAFGLSTTQTSTSTAPNFTFGAVNTPSLSLSAAQAPSISSSFGSTPITTTTGAPPLVFGQPSTASQPSFSFGTLAAANSTSTTNSLTVTTSQPSTTSAPTLNFGALKSSWSPSANQAPENANPVVNAGSFGGVAPPTSTVQSTATLPSTAAAGGFSFSGTSSTGLPKSLFGNTTATATTPSNSNTTFTFSANKTAVAQPNPTNSFTFGSPAATQATNNPVQPPPFGSTTPIKPSNSFSFGAPAPAAPVKSSFAFSSTDKPVAPSATGNSIGGFSFNAPATNSLSAPDMNKNIFGSTAPAADPSKPVFSFGSATSNQTPTKPPMFAASTVKPSNPFGASATTTTQNSPFAFGSSSGTSINQGATAPAPSANLFGAAPTSNQTSSINATAAPGSIFGAPSAAVAPLQQSSTFTFGANPNNSSVESNKPAGGFVFGSSSSIGSNASKPAADMNKTFVFGDGSTTITPAPSGGNLFGGGNATNSGTTENTENKMFLFGGAGAGTAGNNSTFSVSRQAVNPSPVFCFGAAGPATSAPAQNGNLFAPQTTGTQSNMMGTSDRPIRKAMRRLHKT